MMRILRWVSRIVLVLLVLVALLVGYVYVASARLLARAYTTDTNLPQVTLRSIPTRSHEGSTSSTAAHAASATTRISAAS